jgi:hypothetical protein
MMAFTIVAGIHKGQFTLHRLRFSGQAAPAIWNAVLAAWRSGESLDRFHLTHSRYLHRAVVLFAQSRCDEIVHVIVLLDLRPSPLLL